MSDTAVAEPPAETAEAAENESKAIAKVKQPGVYINFYPRTTKEGKPDVYALVRLRRKNRSTGEWEDNPFIHSLRGFDAMIEAAVEAKQFMREFYRDRDASDNGDDEKE